jgi:UDP-3-O-[3-hydroxymyristoyl] N-acetylglucosamine deacetylase
MPRKRYVREAFQLEHPVSAGWPARVCYDARSVVLRIHRDVAGDRMVCQRTLKNVIRATGVGLHSGERVYLTVRPAPQDSGIQFVRTDLHPPVAIPAAVDCVVDTVMATTLGMDGVRVATVEHLMAAFAGLAIDNAQVEVSSEELPIMDGSAAPFVFLLQSAGVIDQPAPRRFLRILREVVHAAGDASARLVPHDGLRLDYTLEYDHPVFRRHSHHATVEVCPTSFIKEISRARTFGFLADYERLKRLNLARGGSLDNAVVVDDEGIMNREGLRLEDEFVKHKILDALGDLYLVGHPVLGAFIGQRSGHTINNGLLRRLLADHRNYELVTAVPEAETAPGELSPAAF